MWRCSSKQQCRKKTPLYKLESHAVDRVDFFVIAFHFLHLMRFLKKNLLNSHFSNLSWDEKKDNTIWLVCIVCTLLLRRKNGGKVLFFFFKNRTGLQSSATYNWVCLTYNTRINVDKIRILSFEKQWKSKHFLAIF